MRGVVVLVVCSVRIAAADVQPPAFPLALVDRPLAIPPGATGLAVGWDFRTYVVDGMRSGFTDNTDPEIAVWHGFGPVELGIALNLSAELRFAIPRWDFFAGGTLYNVTRTGPSTYLEVGFIKRWGI